MRRRASSVAREAARSELEKRGRSDWHPQKALNYAWQRIDPIHGHGGSLYIGRPIRPDDPGYGDGWTWAGFSAALQKDREEIEAVVAEYPEQEARLRQWLQQIETLGRARDRDPASRTQLADYYEALSLLGYKYTYREEDTDD